MCEPTGRQIGPSNQRVQLVMVTQRFPVQPQVSVYAVYFEGPERHFANVQQLLQEMLHSGTQRCPQHKNVTSNLIHFAQDYLHKW